MVDQGLKSGLGYNELTVTDDDFAEEERDRFQTFLSERKEDKELAFGGRPFCGSKSLTHWT